MEYKFKFSVVIPIYDVEDYLEETILSVINQTLDFKKNIQLILVNDGSHDNSEDICLKYKNLYSDNIIYIKQKNGGVSSARNNGLKFVQGEYVNFLDSDDIWDKEAFIKAKKMLDDNKSIDIVAARIKFFEMKNEYHSLDYKFTSERIVDIFEEYDCIQLSAASAFIRTSALEGIEFDTRIKYSEDSKVMYQIILKKEHYGILPKCIYYYRKRNAGNSAIQTSHHDVSWYFDTTEYCYKYVFELSKEKYGYVIPFVQYFVMYDMQWRLLNERVLSQEKQAEYAKIMIELLQNIDDEIILKQRYLYREKKVYYLSLKHGYDIRKDFVYDKGRILYKNIEINNINFSKFMTLNIIDIKDDKLYIEGKYKTYYPEDDYKLYVKTSNKQIYNLECYDIPYEDQIAFDNKVYFKSIGFKVEIPLENVKYLRFMIDYQKIHTKRVHFTCSHLTNIMQDVSKFYNVKGKYILHVFDYIIYIEKNKKGLVRSKEKEYIEALKKIGRKDIVKIRYLFRLLRKFKKKPIWLISDRTMVANDNGMHLFKYINSIDSGVDSYFVISKKSIDYKKMKKIGKVIAYGSLKYKLYFLLADKIISSQADDWVINAFDLDSKYVRDLYKFKFIFLQHGITKDDISSWLHKQNKNIKMFVTAANDEYQYITNGIFGYSNNEVKLTGFPRYDNLKDNSKKQIAIMPTWRKNLAGSINDNTKGRNYNVLFKNSEYFKFYNNLINDERILKKMQELGYKGIFVVHPSHMENYIDFKGNNTFNVVEGFADYQKIFAESNLLITDFSSVAFDFAYLNKPVIYSQFDRNTFFEGHLYNEGYFSYEDDGFGQVTYDYETTVNKILEYLENNCKLEEIYKKRINDFYAYHDHDNCKRVYEEIKKI